MIDFEEQWSAMITDQYDNLLEELNSIREMLRKQQVAAESQTSYLRDSDYERWKLEVAWHDGYAKALSVAVRALDELD